MPSLLVLLGTATAAAFVASLHCLGMCGGFAAALGVAGGAPGARGRFALRHALYHLGKTSSYVFIGVLAAAAGEWLRAGSGFRWAQTALSAGAGALMVLVGLQLLGLLPGRRGPGVLSAWLTPLFAPLLRPAGLSGPLALGVFNGLLPCPLVYAFAAQAAATGSVPAGAAIMVGLGLGSMPALSVAGAAGHWLTAARRRAMVRVAGVLIVAFGVITVVRGLPVGLHASHVMAPADGTPAPPGGGPHEHTH